MRNKDGNPYLGIVGVGALHNIYIILRVTKRLLILKTNSIDTADHCTVKILTTPFISLRDTRIVSLQMQLLLGIMLSLILITFHELVPLKFTFYLQLVRRKKAFFCIQDTLGTSIPSSIESGLKISQKML